MSDLRWLDDAEDPARAALRQALDESERFTHSELMQRRVWARVSDPARTRRATRNAFVRGALVASALTAITVVSVERVHGPWAPVTTLGNGDFGNDADGAVGRGVLVRGTGRRRARGLRRRDGRR